MSWLDQVKDSIENISKYGTIMDFGDVLEIVLIAVLIYYILLWMKNTRSCS